MSCKKIGILTFSYSSNPGSVLQAYALQQTISKMHDYDAFIINYQKTQAGKPIIGKTVFYKPLSKWTIKKIIEWSARIIAHPVRMKKYERFFKKYYNGYPTKRIFRENLPQIADKYDKFVVGSDQVWNCGSYNVDDTYFLDFVKDSSKKISYAASFGKSNIPDDKKSTVKELISDFASISVREFDGIKTVSDLTGKQAEWVVDPSLLMDKENYQKLAILPHIKSKYVFLYLREESKRLEDFSQRLADFYDLKVIKVIKHWRCNKKGKPTSALGPLEWLGYMNNADFVVTNSFHGICFSMTFEKEFFIDLLKGDASSTNPRIKNVLDQFEFTSRSIDEIQDFKDIDRIDYQKVNKIKLDKRNHSLNYLKEALERT